ncbi:MAG: 50S ribosomal protein L13 [Candidatus Aenigmarchaeota archaeon]|nr:50S ribosomal protein L13 [Candidatus Aenigmarchaeota archaeon]
MIVYDAENQILGRISSVIAKQLLKGEKVFVVNCEKAVIAGNPKFIKSKYLQKIHRGDPKHGPFFPKTPDGIFRRTVRGMLPWDRAKGRKAFKNLKVFIGIPEELKNKKIEKIEDADASKLECRYMSLGELSLALGAKRRW